MADLSQDVNRRSTIDKIPSSAIKILKSESPTPLPYQHMTSLLNESTTLFLKAMKAYVEHLASLIAQLKIREKEKETSNTDLKERIEEKEEIKEKEHEKFIEEIENKEGKLAT